jgi:hypothetical protein
MSGPGAAYFWIAVGISVLVSLLAALYVLWIAFRPRTPRSLTPDEEAAADAGAPTPAAGDSPFLWRYIFVLILTGAICGTVWAVLFAFLRLEQVKRLPPAVFLVAPPAWSSIVPAFLLGLVSAAIPCDVCTRLWFRKRYEAFMVGNLSRYGTTNRFVFCGIWLPFLCISPGAALFTAHTLHCHVRFSEDEIGVRDFSSQNERLYDYKQVREVIRSTHSKDDKQVVRELEGRFVLFEDGRLERIQYVGSTMERWRLWDEFVCNKTGKPLRVVKFPEEVQAIARQASQK